MTIAQRSLARRRLAAALAVVALLVLAVPTVRAEDILEINGPITDTTGSLAGREDDIVDAIDRTLDEHGIQAFVVFVGTTEDRTAEEYAFETADTNSLGVDDVLILVAIDDRTDYIWLSDGLASITTDELDAIITGTLEPGLRDGDFADATIATIEALGEAATASSPTDAPATPTPTDTDAGSGGSDGSGDDGGIGLGTIVAVALIGGGGFLVWRQWRKRSAPGGGPTAAPGEAPVDVEALGHEATALLIATDERIRDAAQEVDFAEAQYGPDEVVGLREAVAAARDELTAAFTVRQRLDDEVPEDEPTRIAMLREIVERTTRAQDRLDAETDRIRALRDLERDAPRTLVELPGRIETVEDRVPAAAATLERLGAYAPTAWEPVAGNLEEARKGLAGARDAVIVGSAAASDEDRSRIAVATRQALEGLTGAATLLDAIDALAAAIADAERRLPGELQSATTDLADAEAAVTGRNPAPEAEERRRTAERALLAARAAADARPTDPVEAMRLATEAHRAADEALLVARDAAAAADRIAAAADASLRTAAAEVDRTASFIASRRRGVGDTARTRFAEAQRHLQLAAGLAASDPAGTLDEARRAETLAREAYDLARDDFTDWDQGGPGWGQRSGSGGDQTAEILGQILGGVVGGVLAGGGRRGGGWGGSPWGGGGGGGGIPDIGGALGGGWGGGGGFGSGGFGGGGGGGGRGRGGRW